MKTNAMRILESAGIPFEAKEYDDNTNHVLEKGMTMKNPRK